MRKVTWIFGLGVVITTLAAVACGGGGSGSLGNMGTDSDAGPLATADKSVGAMSVMTRKCVQCHGMDMSGAATPIPYPQDPTVELYPPNLTPDMATGTGSWTDDQLIMAIRNGQDNQGLELCPEMNHFSMMSDFEVNSIVLYLRSIPPVNKNVLRSVCPPLKTKAEQQAAAGM
jgi:hypothetical protein